MTRLTGLALAVAIGLPAAAAAQTAPPSPLFEEPHDGLDISDGLALPAKELRDVRRPLEP